jgi:hypothetical protein
VIGGNRETRFALGVAHKLYKKAGHTEKEGNRETAAKGRETAREYGACCSRRK